MNLGWNEISPLIAPFISGVLGAGLTAWFASRRFYSEKWWDRKFEAYRDLLNALHNVANDYDESFEAYINQQEMPEEREAALKQKREQGREELSRQRYVGDLVINSNAVNVLNVLETELNKRQETYFDHLHESLGALKAAVESIKAVARADLNPRSKKS